MVGDEADRADQDVLDAAAVEILEVVEDVGPEPGLARRRLGLVREGPLAERCSLRDGRRGFEELILVRVALVEDPCGQGVRGEHDVSLGAADSRCEELDEPFVVVPALDEDELGAPGEHLLELRAVAGDREPRVVRREDQPDDSAGACGQGLLGSVGDPRRPVFHPGEDGEPKLLLEGRASLFGDRVERRAALDVQPPVALDEVVEELGPDRLAAADVRVVGGHVREPLRAPVGHQDDGDVAHASDASRTASSASSSRSGSTRRQRVAVSGSTPEASRARIQTYFRPAPAANA